MTWKNALQAAVKKEMQPMKQVTYWVLYLGCGLCFMFTTVHGAAQASYDLVIRNPEIASTSWLSQGWFY